jgi:hypothetical protein
MFIWRKAFSVSGIIQEYVTNHKKYARRKYKHNEFSNPKHRIY